MTRVLVSGDWHGNIPWVKFPIRKAVAENCPIILQVGDFGMWDHTTAGVTYLDQLEIALQVNDLEVWWLDGNHENFDRLYDHYSTQVRDDGKWEIRPHIFYLPRGYRWEWDGITCLALGGAYSIDKMGRIEHSSWWSQELITTADIYRAVEGGRVDIMFTHDCPTGVDPLGPNSFTAIGGYKDSIQESYHNRQMLSAVVDEVRPQRLYHGHYHYRYTGILEGKDYRCDVEGLDRDSSFEKNWTILDTSELTHAE